MTVFVWKQEPQRVMPEDGKDLFSTTWAMPSPECFLCGDRFENGQRVWHWHVDGGTRDLRAHAGCAGNAARGMIKDLAECTR